MNLIHVVESTATGTLSMLVLAVKSLPKCYNITIVYSKRCDTPKDIEKIFGDNVRLIEVDMSLISFPNSFLKLRKIIKTINPDIIHCHSSIGGFIGRLASLNCDSKVFYNPHCISFMRKDITKFKFLIFCALERIASLKKSTYIACSSSEELSISTELPNVPVTVLENAVDLAEFSLTTNFNRDTTKCRVVTVGGIRAQKGPLEFSEIASRFRCEGIEFVWIGDGDNESKQMLIDAGVTVTGWKSRNEVVEELYSADLYLSTALWEGMPVSLIEACAANLPIVARSCAGNVDVVEHKKTGHLFDNTKEAIDLIEQFLQNSEPYKKYANNAYNTVFERFSVERFSKELMEIYNN